ncbi:MAG: 3'-5' exonuclease [Pyrinomonadaceae bacterium]|nr:3'-5' exonuclease [Sphingobacteriaceae bacterium]
MRDFLLFIDTEASGLPKKWNQPYSNSDNWPSAVQISWLIYKSDGSLIKTENHYIGDRDFDIKDSAIEIHGINREYLDVHGKNRKEVMQALADDLFYYQPLVTGHFMEFDYHVTSADFYRAGISNPLQLLPTFCTMLASSYYVRDPSVKYLRLGELYTTLFNEKLENQHNAQVDARATADCFFELLKRGEITDEIIEGQRKLKTTPLKAFKWIIIILISILLVLLISIWL